MYNLAKSNPKCFWSELKKYYKKSTCTPQTITCDDFLKHLKNLLENNEEQNNGQNNDSQFNEAVDVDLDCDICYDEGNTVIIGLKLNKASDTDGVIREVFVNRFDLIYPFLLKLFNALYKSGVYPDQWSTGIIAPIFKKGNPERTNNYRGITLTNIVAKIYSHVLNNRLIKWSKT